MSIRTVVEINHDYLHDLTKDPARLVAFIHRLGSATDYAKEIMPHGIRFLGQRHHSETLKLEVK